MINGFSLVAICFSHAERTPHTRHIKDPTVPTTYQPGAVYDQKPS